MYTILNMAVQIPIFFDVLLCFKMVQVKLSETSLYGTTRKMKHLEYQRVILRQCHLFTNQNMLNSGEALNYLPMIKLQHAVINNSTITV